MRLQDYADGEMPIEDDDGIVLQKGLGHRLQEISKSVANDRRRALSTAVEFQATAAE